MAAVYPTAIAQANNLSPQSQTPIQASATGTAGILSATLAAVAGKFTYIVGFSVTGAGATAASVILVTLTGLATTMSYAVVIPAGATVSITPLVIEFQVPIPASSVGTTIVVTVPSFGAGNISAAVNAHGFQM